MRLRLKGNRSGYSLAVGPSIPGIMPATMLLLVKKAVPPLLVAVSVFFLYLVQPKNIQASDPLWAPHVMASLLYDGDPYLDEYRHWVEEFQFYAAFEREGRIHSIFPMGGQLLSLPSMIILDAVLPELRGTTLADVLIELPPRDPLVLKIHLINAALLVALSAGVVYLIGREALRPPYALVLTATYAFGTSAYSTASRALWQHGPSMLALSVVLLLLLRARNNPELIKFAGLPVAAAFIIRPTNSVTVLVVTLYVLLFYRKQLAGYLMFALLLAVPFVLWNLSLYDSLLPPYFSAGRLGAPTMGEALLGNLVSPARGLLVFSPVFILVPIGIAIQVINGRWSRLDWAVGAILALHLLVISSFPHWWAGHSFGPRFFADMLPFLVYLVIPVLEVVQSGGFPAAVRVVLGGLYIALALAGIAIHTHGAISVATIGWNSLPVDVDKHPDRLWDWSDLQFMRGLGANLSAVSPSHITIPATGGEAGSGDYSIDIANLTDEPLDVVLYLPARVRLGDNPHFAIATHLLPGGGTANRLRDGLPPLALREVNITIDANGTSPGQSLPAIAVVTGKPEDGAQAREEWEIVTLSIGDGPAGSPALPEDITIDCASTADTELFAVFGAGWYDREKTDDASWRWASTPALLHVWSDKRQDVTLSVVPSSFHSPSGTDGLGSQGELDITLPDGNLRNLLVQSGQPVTLDADLHRGWNLFAFELAAGYFRPSDPDPGHFDRRELAFSIDDIALSGVCQSPTP